MFKRLLIIVLMLAVCSTSFAALQAISGLRDKPDDAFIFVRNTTGASLGHGMVVIWNVSEDHGVDVDTTISADSELVAGVVPDSTSTKSIRTPVADDGYLYIQIRGVNDDIIEGTTTSFVAGQSIGTDVELGTCDDGDGVGVALETSTDGRASCWINLDN